MMCTLSHNRFWSDDVMAYSNTAWTELLDFLDDNVGAVWKLLYAVKSNEQIVESATDDFVVSLMRVCGFQQKYTLIRWVIF